MVFVASNSRFPVRAVRPNPGLWGQKEAAPFVRNAHAAIADFAPTKTAYTLAGQDIASRLIIGEVVLDQVIALHASRLEKGVGSQAIVEVAEIISAHIPGNRYFKIELGVSQEQINSTVEDLSHFCNIATGVWQLT